MHTELGIQTDTIHSEQQNELIASNKTTGWPIARCELANGQRLSRVGVASPASSAMDGGVGAGGGFEDFRRYAELFGVYRAGSSAPFNPGSLGGQSWEKGQPGIVTPAR